MNCPMCLNEMIWQCDYDLEEGLLQQDYECPDCKIDVSIYSKGEEVE